MGRDRSGRWPIIKLLTRTRELYYVNNARNNYNEVNNERDYKLDAGNIG